MLDQPLKLAIGLAIGAAATGIYLSNQPSSGGMGALGALFQSAKPSLPAAAVQAPPRPASTLGFGKIELRPDQGGHYHADAEIEGRSVPMLVDTGATLVTLTYADARRLGLAPAPSDYTVNVQTANGLAKAARISLREVRIQNLLVRDVPALVMPETVVGTSLLGMSFLKRLGGFETASGNLVLRP
jgi:aspartyl protease family protein